MDSTGIDPATSPLAVERSSPRELRVRSTHLWAGERSSAYRRLRHEELPLGAVVALSNALESARHRGQFERAENLRLSRDCVLYRSNDVV